MSLDDDLLADSSNNSDSSDAQYDPYSFLGYRSRIPRLPDFQGNGPYAEVFGYLHDVQNYVGSLLSPDVASVMGSYLNHFWTLRCIETKDDEEEKVPILPCHAYASNVLRDQIRNDTPPEELIVNVSRKPMLITLHFIIVHVDLPLKEIPRPIPSNDLRGIVCDEDADLMDSLDQAALFDVVQTANYLDVRGLVELSCACVAAMIKGKTPEEIRRTFDIASDFTPEEEAAVRSENRWADDD